MSSLDGIFTLHPDELWKPKTTLSKIASLSNPEALALLPKIGTLLAQEANAWAEHIAVAQSDSYTTILARAHAAGAAPIAVQEMATHHVAETMPARFAALNSKNGGEKLEPLSGMLRVLREQVLGVRQVVYDPSFDWAVLRLEALMTDLEFLRLTQLRQLQVVIGGSGYRRFKETEHVVAFVGAMVELGVDVDGLLPKDDDDREEESDDSETTNEDEDGV